MKNKKSLENQIQQIISSSLINDFNDDFLGSITITSVVLQKGDSEAIVYFNSFGNKESAIKKMNQISSKLNKKVSSSLDMYRAPKVIVKYDDKLNQINKIESLLDSIKDDLKEEE